jgi:hypothetical protein
MRPDFCVFIISHGRPDKVVTYPVLMRAGYTGKVYIVIDDEDKTADGYHKNFGDKVLVFSKEAIAPTFDHGDNFNNRRTTSYVRNACFDLAEQVGCRYFLVLDDDYSYFHFRADKDITPAYIGITKHIDMVLMSMLDFYIESGVASVAMSQGGDWIGGNQDPAKMRRKCMNSFFCSVERRFSFIGRMNEDVNTYVTLSTIGKVFFTVMQVQLVQKPTQATTGGMTEAYAAAGTYVKSFYTVMYAPSCVKIGAMGDPSTADYRIHHAINWNNAAPKILRETWRKPRPAPTLTEGDDAP